MNYFGWAAGQRKPAAGPAPTETLPAIDDPLAITARLALDAHILGWSQERTAQLLLERGAGITVEETSLPDTVRTRFLTLEEMADQEALEEAALVFAKARR